MDPSQLEPIETHLREESPPPDATVVVRGGPLTVAKFVEHAVRQAREFSYNREPMSSISVYLTVDGWTVDAVLQERLWSRSTYAVCQVAALDAAGYVLLPTHESPHHDVVLPESTERAAGTLLAVFGEVRRNPFKHRRR